MVSMAAVSGPSMRREDDFAMTVVAQRHALTRVKVGILDHVCRAWLDVVSDQSNAIIYGALAALTVVAVAFEYGVAEVGLLASVTVREASGVPLRTMTLTLRLIGDEAAD